VAKTGEEISFRNRADELVLKWHPLRGSKGDFFERASAGLDAVKRAWKRGVILRLAKKQGEGVFPVLEEHGYPGARILREHSRLLRQGERELPGFRDAVLRLIAQTPSLGVAEAALNSLYADQLTFEPLQKERLEQLLKKWREATESGKRDRGLIP